MIKITVNGLEHILETLEDNTPDFEGYSTSINTQNALKTAYDAGDWQPYTPPEPEPAPELPNWDGFNAAIMIDPQLNALLGAVLTIAPAIALGLPSALAQVADHGPTAFNLTFNALCSLGGATEGDRAAWAAMAETNHLPADFVAIIQGSG